MKKRVLIPLLLAVLATVGVFVYEFYSKPAPEIPPVDRPDSWAWKMDEKYLDNFYLVSDDLYRGAKTTAEGMERLKELKVRTVVNLMTTQSDREEIGESGLAYEHIYFNPENPEEKEMVRFLQIVGDPYRTPVFVHCRHGSDRTGTMCALYRIAIQEWPKEEALREMHHGGYGFHYRKYEKLKDFIRNLDIEDIKKRAGLEELQKNKKPEAKQNISPETKTEESKETP